ncbi:MAG: hypothetical protein ACLP36_09870, partial [Acidimicrobiales bacterium]
DEIAQEVLAELTGLAPSRSELLPMEPGRYRLGAWTFDEEPAGSSVTPTRARAVAGILPAVTGSPDQLGGVIAAVGRLLEETRAVPLRSSSQQELMKSIEERVVDSPLRLV